MNIVFLSPHFPPNFRNFCVHLNRLGANALGIADADFESLHNELKFALREYYRVSDMHNYDALMRALGYFTHRHGRIDRLDSLNEYWLETEARLRTDFNIPGIQNDTIQRIKRKSLMKEEYIKAGVPVARGRVTRTLDDAQSLIAETGYPVVAKPDIGVGAAQTYKIHHEAELKNFFESKPAVDYIMEEFVDGQIVSFDGLTDRDGNLVFYTAHEYSSGIMETVNEDALVYYYSLRDIPTDLEDAGRRVLKAFDVRERFFHFEFFRRRSDQKIVALEVNMRPPGGLTMDMFNFANDADLHFQWANIIVNNQFTAQTTRPYHCAYVSRKSNRAYAHSHEDVLRTLGSRLCHHESISGVFSAALGDYGYLLRTTQLDEVHDLAAYIQKDS